MTKCPPRTFREIVLAFVLLALCPPVAALQPEGDPDHVVPGWYLGMPVISMSWEVLSMEDRLAARIPEGVATQNAYIIAPVSDTLGTSPEREIKLPDRTVVLPAHQAAATAMNAPGEPVLGVGWFVIAGENATEENLRTDPRPENGWASAPLAREIRMGTEWVPLNNHVIIEYGLDRGILDLEYFDSGAMFWATLDWENHSYQPEMTIICETNFEGELP